MLRSTALGDIAIQTGLVTDTTARLMVSSHEAVARETPFEDWAVAARFFDTGAARTLLAEFAHRRYLCSTCQTLTAGEDLTGDRDLACPICGSHLLRGVADEEDARLTQASNRYAVAAAAHESGRSAGVSSSSCELVALPQSGLGLGDDPLHEQIPSHIDEWQILGEIGRGGTGCVYRALDPALDRLVVIKLLHASAPAHAERFDREARATARLDHPGVVKVQTTGVYDGRPYLVMEFVDGRSLRDVVVEDGPLPVETALEVAIQVADALRTAHQAGVIHRDIKPANILQLKNGRGVKVTDFGLARLLDVSVRLTSPGAILGTPLFMAPEQVLDKDVSAATDVYGLGATLYWLITGEPPFQGTTHGLIMHQHVAAPFPLVADKLPGIGKGMDRLLQKMCAKDPADRYPTMADAANAMALALLDVHESSGRLPTLDVVKLAGRDAHADAEKQQPPVQTPPHMVRSAIPVRGREPFPVEVLTIHGELDDTKWRRIEIALHADEPTDPFHLVLDLGDCRSVSAAAAAGLLRCTEQLAMRGARVAMVRVPSALTDALEALLANSHCVVTATVTEAIERITL